MAFHEIQFPTGISYGSSGGPSRHTDIVTLASGFEHRNSPWAQSLREFNVKYGLKSYDLLYALMKFWEARGGQLHGFRYKDFSDYKSCAPQQTLSFNDQTLGTADGVLTTFQLIKSYDSGAYAYSRAINKPVSGTVRVSKNSVESLSGWTVNTATGIVTFTSPPSNGTIIRAGFEFDVPVRFKNPALIVNMAAFAHGDVPDVELLELRL